MDVLLIDVDRMFSRRTVFPNLALMKISRYHKMRGDRVFLNRFKGVPDLVYISCVFTWNRKYAFQIAKMYECLNVEVHVGGPGVDLENKLPDEIEHLKPDYGLYRVDYSMGFTSRGCIRRCPWCIVWRKEGYIREWAPLEEFLEPRFRKLILLDNNFLASPLWEEKLVKIIRKGLMVNFNQGLDIRLVDRDVAKLLRAVKFYNHTFKCRKLHFSWDIPSEEDEVIEGIENLFKAGFRPWELMFYVLVGYNTTFEEDMYRVKKLISLGIDPFVMVYMDQEGKVNPDPKLKHLARWVNKRIYKVVPWEKYEHSFSWKKLREKTLAQKRKLCQMCEFVCAEQSAEDSQKPYQRK